MKKETALFFILFLAMVPSMRAQQIMSDRIKLNQLGFYPNAPKIAVITGEVNAIDFYITSTN